jgi:hypothetical protein
MLARSNCNTAAALAVAALSASTAIAPTPAMARHGWGHHGGWGHHHGWAHRGRGTGTRRSRSVLPAMGLTGILSAIDLLPVLAALAFAYVGL